MKQEVIDGSHNTFRTDIFWILNPFKNLSKIIVFCFVFQFFLTKGRNKRTTHFELLKNEKQNNDTIVYLKNNR